MTIGGESYSKPRIENLPQPAFGWAQRKNYHMGTMLPAGEVVRLGRGFVELIEKTFIRLYPLFLFAGSVPLAAELERFRAKFQ
ncbi:MAG: hypothetical protein FVQ81_02785 [Candidatus Glassbacteria bacterium]|nr:hypothetical protein [Candidatus Glassbacteria bacterium]